MKRAAIAVASALLVAVSIKTANAAELPGPDASGWYSWTVASLGAVSNACCFEMKRGSVTRRVCDLDSSRGAYMSNGDCRTGPGELQVYAFMDEGRPVKIRALSSECAVSTDTGITQIGVTNIDLSVEWLRNVAFSVAEHEVREEAVAALAGIPDDSSIMALVDIVKARRLDRDLRDKALFWLAQSDSDTAFEYIDKLLTRR